MMRTLPASGSSARMDSLTASAWPSPSGEMKAEPSERVIAAARRSTVTSLATDARLFEASAVQIVIRYWPSGTGAPAFVRPSHV